MNWEAHTVPKVSVWWFTNVYQEFDNLVDSSQQLGKN
jgi:hypothetical protein